MSFGPLASDCAPGESAMLDGPWLELIGRLDVLNITHMLEGVTYWGGFQCTWPVAPKELFPVIRVFWPGEQRNQKSTVTTILCLLLEVYIHQL
jgi:hypothetical protein